MDVHVEVLGSVQGVGYRDSLRRRATAAGVDGWVRNRRDGRVEAVLHGPDDAVRLVLDWMSVGPSMADVARVLTRPARNDELPTGDGFELRPSA